MEVEEDWDAHFSASDDSPGQLITSAVEEQFCNNDDGGDEEDWGAHFESVPNNEPRRNELSTDDVLEDEEDWGSHFSVENVAGILETNIDDADSSHPSSILSHRPTRDEDRAETEINAHVDSAPKHRSDHLDESDRQSQPQTAFTKNEANSMQEGKLNTEFSAGVGNFPRRNLGSLVEYSYAGIVNNCTNGLPV